MLRALSSAIFIAAVMVPVATPAGAAVPASPSLGCDRVNDPSRDGFYNGSGVTGSFLAGERITVTASPPTALGPATIVELRVNNVQVDAAPFPATVSYTFPEDAITAAVGWSVDPGDATFTVSCSPVSPSVGCTELNRADYDGTRAGSGLPGPLSFGAGERITANATGPASGSPTFEQLIVNGGTVDTRAFPGTASFTFAADTTATVDWKMNAGAIATWSIRCTPRNASDGCATVNQTRFDGLYSDATVPATQFFAGERVTATAGPPTSGAVPTAASLRVDTALVDNQPFPGAVSYTFPSDGMFSLDLRTDGNATWTVTCTPAPVDSTAPTCAITAVRRPGASGRDEMVVTLRDEGSGLGRITNVVLTNADFSVESYVPGTHVPVTVTATKIVQGSPARWSFDVTDGVGNARHCA